MTDLDERDMLAAEYALGTLDPAERDGVAARLGTDAELARAVRAWEDRLSPLIDGVREIVPPAAVFEGIAARLFDGPGRGVDDARARAWRRQVRRWRGATAGFALLAASLAAWIAVRDTDRGSAHRTFTAVLQRDAGAPAMVIDVDLAARRLTLRPLAGEAPAGRAFELWIIDPALGAPRSLGVVPAAGEARDSLRSYDAAVITGATYAVTVEPPGGSPTGRPTGAPILSGKLFPFPS